MGKPKQFLQIYQDIMKRICRLITGIFYFKEKHNMGSQLQLYLGMLIFGEWLGFVFGINQKFSLSSSSLSNG
jgi:hypothetical protein